jgi:heat shock protein HtpX
MGNAFKTTILLAALAGLLIAIGGWWDGQNGMLLAFGLACVMNMGAYWFSGDIALRMAGAHEVTYEQAPWLYDLIGEVATAARLPRPRIAIIDSASPNAFATGRDPNHAVVAVTRGIMQLLSREELAGVLGHELGHVRSRDILISSIAATVAGAIALMASMARFAMIFGGGYGGRGRNNDGGGLLAILLAPLAATIIQLAVSRTREYAADRSGAQIVGNPEALARALEKLEGSRIPMPVNPAAAHLFIVNPFKGMGAGLAGLFSTHPPIAERVRRLRAMEGQPFRA